MLPLRIKAQKIVNTIWLITTFLFTLQAHLKKHKKIMKKVFSIAIYALVGCALLSSCYSQKSCCHGGGATNFKKQTTHSVATIVSATDAQGIAKK